MLSLFAVAAKNKEENFDAKPWNPGCTVSTFQYDIRYQRTRIDLPTNFEQDPLYTVNVHCKIRK